MKQTNNENQKQFLKIKEEARKINFYRFIPACLWMAVIFYLSSKTGEELDQVIPFFQRYFPNMSDFNWGHYVSYFVLAMTFDFAFAEHSNQWRYKVAIVLLCTVYGITDEWHQYFVGGRMMDIMDVRNDFIGALLWTLIIKIPFLYSFWKKLYRII